MTILIEINNGQPIRLMWYLFIFLFFRILALENIAKILTTGPRLASNEEGLQAALVYSRINYVLVVRLCR